MKKCFAYTFLSGAALAISSAALADSPLTTTSFHEGYEEIIASHNLNSGVLLPELADKLATDQLDLGEKIAIVNALGWDFNGKKNTKVFAKALERKYGSLTIEEGQVNLAYLSADELLVLGYLQAMDDYFHPARALGYLEAASMSAPKSLGIAVVRGLVRAQLAGDVSNLPPESRCETWNSVKTPLTKPKSFKVDIKLKALAQPLSYMSLYKCNAAG